MKNYLWVMLAFMAFDVAKAQQSFTLRGKLTQGSKSINGFVRTSSRKTGISTSGGTYTISAIFVGDTLRFSTLHAPNQQVSFVFTDTSQTSYDIDFELPIAIEKIEVEGVPYITESTRSTLGKAEIAKQNVGQDLPYLLNFTPSVVVSSDAGAGIGYTGIRIRGSDQTRINTTINGIPLNDPESQGVFWVNMPDLASSASSIQIQRGIGTSTNGAGAFGASLHVQTYEVKPSNTPSAELNHSWGSFDSWKHTLKASTGLMKSGFVVDVRLSAIRSEGFIERAASDLRSLYLSGGYYSPKTQFRFNLMQGKEKTYQAWFGVSEEMLKTNRRFNPYTYDNQTDNYQQNHYQAIIDHSFSSFLSANVSLFYVRGLGYYEELRENEAFAAYNLPYIVLGNDTITTTNLVRRRWLDNHFYGTVYSLNYEKNNWNMVWGGGLNHYKGKHFGEIIWAKIATNSNIRERYYDNDAQKIDFNQFLKISKDFRTQAGNRLAVFADFQYRHVGYNFIGFDRNLNTTAQQVSFNFINPKAGINYSWQQHRVHLLAGIAHREPNRNDFTESTPSTRPQAEQLRNIETGYQVGNKQKNLKINAFLMQYQNELILTGKVNDVGAYTRTNVPRSHRVGLEVEGNYQISKHWIWQANATISQNKIRNFTEFLDDYDQATQQINLYRNSDLAFSPRFIAANRLTILPIENLEISLTSKYVGKQYLDNTQNENRRLKAFFVNDLRIAYVYKPVKGFRALTISVLFNNLLNEQYEANGYTFSYISENKKVTESYYYPQAGSNFMLNVGILF